MKVLLVLSFLIGVYGNCVSRDRKDYTCSSLARNGWSFHRNFDTSFQQYWSNYLRVYYQVERISVVMPSNEMYIFDTSHSPITCTDNLEGTLFLSTCSIPRFVNGLVDYSSILTLVLEKQNGGTRNYTVINKDYVWLGIRVELPPHLIDPDAVMTIETSTWRNFPVSFAEYMHLNVNNLTKETGKEAVRVEGHEQNKSRLLLDGLTYLKLEAEQTMEFEGPTFKDYSFWSQLSENYTVRFWLVAVDVPKKVTLHHQFTGTEQYQILRQTVIMKLGVWRNGKMNMPALFITAMVLSFVGLCLLLGLCIFGCCLARRKRIQARLPPRVVVVEGQARQAQPEAPSQPLQNNAIYV